MPSTVTGLVCLFQSRNVIAVVSPRRTFKSFCRLQDGTKSHNGGGVDLRGLFSKPKWSLSSLVSSESHRKPGGTVTPAQLRHLLRLSALPPPQNDDDERHMLHDLDSQLRFVREIQSVDTAGVNPLRSLRDETVRGEEDTTLGLNHPKLQEALAKETVLGKHHRRIRRKHGSTDTGMERWDPTVLATKRSGRYFVVQNGKPLK